MRRIFLALSVILVIFASCSDESGLQNYAGYNFRIDDSNNVIFCGIDNEYDFDSSSFSVPNTIYGIPVTSIYSEALKGYKFSCIIIPQNVKKIEYFGICSNIKELLIESEFIQFDGDVFKYCKNLKIVKLFSKNPPSNNGGIPVSDSLKIFVPSSSVFAYKNNSAWEKYAPYIYALEDFSNIDFEETTTTKISAITDLKFTSYNIGTKSTFSLSWSSVEKADTYQIYYTTSLNKQDWKLCCISSYCNATITEEAGIFSTTRAAAVTITSGKIIAFKVVATNVNSSIQSEDSNIVYYSKYQEYKCIGDISQKSSQLCFYVIRTGQNSYKLNWNNSHSYYVYFYNESGGGFLNNKKLSGSTFTYNSSYITFYLRSETNGAQITSCIVRCLD